MIGVKRLKVDDRSSIGGVRLHCYVQGSFANGYLEITTNSMNKLIVYSNYNNLASD